MAMAGTTTAYASNRPSDTTVYVVTYPDGRTEEFTSDTDAYRALSKTGGGIRAEFRPS